MSKVKEIVKAKYLNKKLVFLYDHSSVHRRFSDDALNIKRMNLKPGGKQVKMHDTINSKTNLLQH
jgi:hypothetical protein